MLFLNLGSSAKAWEFKSPYPHQREAVSEFEQNNQNRRPTFQVFLDLTGKTNTRGN